MTNECVRGATSLFGGLELWEQVAEYDSIYADFLKYHRGRGVRFGTAGKGDAEVAEVRDRLRSRGTLFRNGGASVSVNGLSTACEACTGCQGSETLFISLRCSRNCYFCFNPNQADYRFYLSHDRDWRAEFDKLQNAGREMTHIGLTGGEPLLCLDEALEFLREAHARWPQAHLRLYTTGDGLTEEAAEALESSGLSEIRFSIKLDEGEESRRRTLRLIELMQRRGAVDVMVEMPVVPGTLAQMKRLLHDLDEIGVFGINLLEFCFPLHNWQEFEKRGFVIKNPPFPVLYDWGYAGGLPVEGSELESLRLLEFALDEGLSLGVHYCSLANKHCDQVFTQNRMGDPGPAYWLDSEDRFFKTCKAFGAGALRARELFRRVGSLSWEFDAQDGSMAFHSDLLPLVQGAGVAVAVSFNVLERRGDDVVIRELALKRV